MKELQIISKENEKLFNRVKVKGKFVTDGVTPNRKDICTVLASNLNKPIEQVIVSKLKSGYGSPICVFEAYIYDSKEAVKKFELKHILKRHKHLVTEKPKEVVKNE